MKYVTLIFLMACSHLSIADCDFSGKVHPEEKRLEVEELYNYTCEWFAEVFEVSYDPSITLDSVSYVNSEDEIESLKEKNKPFPFLGYFDSLSERETNDIYVVNSENPLLEEDEIFAKSRLFHELVHFFTKKSSFEIVKDVELNEAMHEVIAFWSQNQYIEMNTGNRLMDYVENKTEECEISMGGFASMADFFLMEHPEDFLCYSNRFLNEDRVKRFNKIISGKYREQAYSFRHVIGER